MNTPLRIFIVAIIAVLAVSGMVAVYILFFSSVRNSPAAETSATEIRDAARNGDAAKALELYQEKMSASNADATSRAIAARNIAGIQYRETGDIQHIIESVNTLKASVLDSKVLETVRAENLAALAQAYHQSGENPQVYAEMFRGSPFDSYYNATATTTSLRNLYEWSYQISPTPRAAIGVASSDMLTILNAGEKSTDESHLIGEAEQYLQYADALAQARKDDQKFLASRRYSGYLFWRAFTVGALALTKGGPYTASYKDAYATFFTEVEKQNSAQSAVYIPVAHWHYAIFLMQIDRDTLAATQQMKAAVAGISTQNQDFINMIRNALDGNLSPNDFLGNSLLQLSKISPELKTYSDSLQ